LIVSGSGTGKMVDVDELRRVVELRLGVPVLVGSGVHERSVMRCLEFADGVIVGTSLKQDGQTTAPLDPDRVARFVAAARARRSA
jgi:predicted TIM-barrel enzyme